MEEYVSRHEYMERVGRIDERTNSLDKRLTKVEEMNQQLNDITVTMKGILVTLRHMQEEQTEQSERLRKIEEEPGDTWKKVKWTALACGITFLITGVLTSIATWLCVKGGF